MAAKSGRWCVMFTWGIGGLGALFNFVGDAAGDAIGWAWETVIHGSTHGSPTAWRC